MSITKLITLMFVLLSFTGVIAAPKYPFPQQATYPHGTLPSGIDHKHVQAAYDIWYANYYTESGDQARIKFDEPGNTVSEGIGYGMLIMVFMDNEKNNTQAKFDKLWKYYNTHSSNGLMNWKVQGFTNNTPGSGAATDAELDVAVALIMASKQWNDTKYLNDAKTLIDNIYSQEVKNNILVGGNQWTALNPSYMSMVATQLFQSVDGSRWSTVQSNCYSLLKKSQNQTTGLWPNWCQENGTPGGGVGDNPALYGFDASRTPWRLGWAYAWYGHPDAKTLCNKIVGWFKQHTDDTPGKIGQIYNLDGTINTGAKGSQDNIPTFLGPLTVGGIVDAGFKTWVDKGYTRLRAFGGKDDNYYNECLELLSMLLLTGNMPDFTTAQPKSSVSLKISVTPSGAGTITLTPQKSSYSINETVQISTTNSDPSRYAFVGWDGDLTGTATSATLKAYCDMNITAIYKDKKAQDIVDDCEDNNHLTNLKSEWFTYTDILDQGKSTITPKTERKKVFFTMTANGYNNSKYAAKIDFKLDKGGFKYDPYVGVGFEISPDSLPVDISKATGISFYYKGSFGDAICALKIESRSVKELGADFNYELPASTSWKEVNITWDKFLQPTWAEPVNLDLKQVPKFQWQIQGTTGASGELWIDDVHLIGYPIDLPTGTRQADRPVNVSEVNKTFSVSQHKGVIHFNYSAAQTGVAIISIYNISGELIAQYERPILNANDRSFSIDCNDNQMYSGNYVVTLSLAGKSWSRQLTFIKN
jgi:endo-1,4-beta-D-glucanase Y